MHETSYNEVNSILNKLLNDKINLPIKFYYKLNKNSVYFYYYSSIELINYSKLKGITSFGIPIFYIKNDKIKLLPGIINIIQGLNIIKLTKKEAIQISYGKSIEYKFSNNVYLLFDTLDRKISIGKIIEHELSPIVDLGYYLREE